MNIDELNPARSFPLGIPNDNPRIIANPKQSTPTFAFLRKPITIASNNAMSDNIPRFIAYASCKNVMHTGISVGIILSV